LTIHPRPKIWSVWQSVEATPLFTQQQVSKAAQRFRRSPEKVDAIPLAGIFAFLAAIRTVSVLYQKGEAG
jgi:hypothetical protein